MPKSLHGFQKASRSHFCTQSLANVSSPVSNPQRAQAVRFKGKEPQIAHPDILVTQLGPGRHRDRGTPTHPSRAYYITDQQRHFGCTCLDLHAGEHIKLECHAQKGCGETHMKWSPATVFYQMLPKVTSRRMRVQSEVTLVALIASNKQSGCVVIMLHVVFPPSNADCAAPLAPGGAIATDRGGRGAAVEGSGCDQHLRPRGGRRRCCGVNVVWPMP